MWDIKNGRLLYELDGHSEEVWRAVFSPNSSMIVTTSEDKTACVWDTKDGRLLHRLEGHTGRVSNAAFSPNGQLIVTASDDKNSADLGNRIQVELCVFWGVTRAAWHKFSFSKDSSKLITSSFGSITRLWDVASGVVLNLVSSHFPDRSTDSVFLTRRRIGSVRNRKAQLSSGTLRQVSSFIGFGGMTITFQNWHSLVMERC